MSVVRVLHVFHSMNCGGAETLIMNVYRNLDRSKIQFDFLVNYFDDMFYEKEIEKLGGKIYRMKFLTQVTPPIYERQLYRFFKSHPEYKTVHSHLETTTGIILKQAKKAGVPKRIAHSHNSRFTREGILAVAENIYKSYCRKKIAPNATELLSCSDKASKWLYGDKSAQATIIKNGIESEKYAYDEAVRIRVRQQLGIDNNTKVLGHVGRFNDQKNHQFLIDIFEQYRKHDDNCVLILVGEGDLKQAIKQKVKSKGLESSVEFLGLRSDVNEVLQGFDIFLLPSLFEGLPLVIVEAQASGLPCLTADTISPLSDLGCGLVEFLPIDNVDTWAKKITSIHKERKVTTEQIKKAGYDIISTAKILEKIYFDV
ncbi:MAG TPA: glycosyltransferase family 1 protein [Clostridia bacterium]|nr:glycosyltransferase family 1 protein [Clostridia bacterium]